MRRLKIGKSQIEVWPNAHVIALRAAELFVETAMQSVEERDSFKVALSGGSTPRALYGLLTRGSFLSSMPWEKTQVFWSDERCVPPTSEESNYRMAFDAMLRHVPVRPEQVHRMRGEDEPDEAARSYSQLLREKFDESPPRFDLILLGLGEDCHTASLFPHSPAILDADNLVSAPYVEKLKAHRLTLTFPVINEAASVIFLVAGESKADALSIVLEEEVSGMDYPAQLVSPTQGNLLWLVDEAAAARLTQFEEET
ncbi:MAG TPA: 6-phosphogluconolactonase [Pyrinomonadaceae bacterium]|nr:6-phosphogluconolactonase [Pyrinomonadaceae bacterium]